MATVVRREGEDLESLIHRFRRKVNDANIIGDLKRKEAFVPKSETARLARKEAIRKQQKLVRIEKAKENPKNGKHKKYFKRNPEQSKPTEQPKQS